MSLTVRPFHLIVPVPLPSLHIAVSCHRPLDEQMTPGLDRRKAKPGRPRLAQRRAILIPDVRMHSQPGR
jgi:hypothetical protein